MGRILKRVYEGANLACAYYLDFSKIVSVFMRIKLFIYYGCTIVSNKQE